MVGFNEVQSAVVILVGVFFLGYTMSRLSGRYGIERAK